MSSPTPSMDPAEFWKMQELLEAEEDDDVSGPPDVGALALKHIREAQAIPLDLRRTLERGTEAIQRLREFTAPAQFAEFEGALAKVRMPLENTEVAGASPLPSLQDESVMESQSREPAAAKSVPYVVDLSTNNDGPVPKILVHEDETANHIGLEQEAPLIDTTSLREPVEADTKEAHKSQTVGARSKRCITPEKQMPPAYTRSSPRRSPRLQHRIEGKPLASSALAVAPQTPQSPRQIDRLFVNEQGLTKSERAKSPEACNSSSSIPSPKLHVPKNIMRPKSRRGKPSQPQPVRHAVDAMVADGRTGPQVEAEASPLNAVTNNESCAKTDSSQAKGVSGGATEPVGTESQPIEILDDGADVNDRCSNAERQRADVMKRKPPTLARSQTVSAAGTKKTSARGFARLKKGLTTGMAEESGTTDSDSGSASSAKRRKPNSKKDRSKLKPQVNPATGRVPNPQAPKIFEGLLFLFLPNGSQFQDSVRMIEYQNALDRGAEIVHDLTSNPTHIICADQHGYFASWNYERVVLNLGMEAPPRHVSLVTYDFFHHSFRRGKRMMEEHYPVPGHLEALEKQAREEKAEREVASQAATVAKTALASPKRSDEQDELEELPIEIPDSQGSLPQPPTKAHNAASPTAQLSPHSRSDQRVRLASPPSKTENAFTLVPKAVPLPWTFGSDGPDPKARTSRKEPPRPRSRKDHDRREEDQTDRISTPSSEDQLNSLEEVIREAKGSFQQDHTELTDFSTFACMQPGRSDGTGGEPNALLIEKLEEMLALREQQNDQWRTLAYRKALNTIRKLPDQITSEEQARKIPNIGDSLARKIGEILDSGDLTWLKYAKNDEDGKVLRDFTRVYDVGRVQAGKWMKAGYRRLEDLRTKAKLTSNQQIGLDHYEDFLARIGRPEVQCHEGLVQSALENISDQVEMTIMGSYRRGTETCGDIDFLITPKEDNISKDSLFELVYNQLIPLLKALNYIQATLSEPSPGGSKWMGAAKIPGKFGEIWRRVDFLTVPYDQRGAAFIYFTGDNIFNRSIRLLASKKGMRLNEKGLYKDVLRGPDREKLNVGTLVEGRDERKIFKALEVPYREPWDRNVR